MPKIVIENLYHKEIQTNEPNCKVIELIHENYIDWMHACGKKGKCTTCKMIVVEGKENLSPLSRSELDFRENGRLEENQRLTCQCQLANGTIRIKVAPENKFPHMNYSD